jgi:hypothetical protein
VLNPEQTERFFALVDALQNVASVSMAAMPDLAAVSATGGTTGNFSVDQITVNVDKLADDQDYEELAERIYDTLLERIRRGSSIGGLFSNM